MEEVKASRLTENLDLILVQVVLPVQVVLQVQVVLRAQVAHPAQIVLDTHGL